LLEMKGLSTLIKAFSLLEHENLKLLLVGSGEYKDKMLKIAGDLGISHNLIFTDSVPAEDVPKYINCMDVLVLPSITTSGWVEFFGRVLVEAMVCRVPVIGSSSGEIPNVVGDAGLIFHEGDERDLKDKLDMVIKDVDLRQSLIEKGYDRATSLFIWESIGKDTYTVYKELMGY
ncbi:glycosyltransferase, partial [Candidatus Poribacteria bacterium]|nr:glycosyltransferase [Candidatus Poribacteria bacterium]